MLGIRKGKTQYETILKNLFEEIDIHPITDHYICLTCGDMYPLPDANKFPKSCKKCGDFKLQGKYVMPDLIVKNEEGYPDSIGVIYVNGGVHTKHKQAKKDEHQIERLVKLGYKVFVFENDDVIALSEQKTFITQAALRHIHSCIKFEFKYQQILSDEKEMAGVSIIRGCAPWVKL